MVFFNQQNQKTLLCQSVYQMPFWMMSSACTVTPSCQKTLSRLPTAVEKMQKRKPVPKNVWLDESLPDSDFHNLRSYNLQSLSTLFSTSCELLITQIWNTYQPNQSFWTMLVTDLCIKVIPLWRQKKLRQSNNLLISSPVSHQCFLTWISYHFKTYCISK